MDHVEVIAREGALLVEAVRRSDPDTPVPACGVWTVRELAGHVGQVHRWATTVVRTGQAVDDDAAVPADAGLVPWLEEGLRDLCAALSSDPDRPCWTFTGPATVRWWQRRQALETLVHRVDAERAAGAVSPVDAGLAADGVAEVAEVLHPRQVRLGRCAPPSARVELTASDTGTSAVLPGPEPAVTVHGRAELLLLLLWRRTTPHDPGLRVRGDRRLLEAVLAGPSRREVVPAQGPSVLCRSMSVVRSRASPGGRSGSATRASRSRTASRVRAPTG